MPEERCKRWVRFSEVSFGIAPVEELPGLRHDLLEFEPFLAVRQHDVGCVQGYDFDPEVPEGTKVMPAPYACTPD